MPDSIIHGEVSQLSWASETTGTISGGRNVTSGAVDTWQIATFRIDKTPVQMKLDTQASICDGDSVAVAGCYKKGVFIARAIKNNTTNVISTLPAWKYKAMGVVLMIIGILLTIFLIGIPIILLGAYTFYQGALITKAVEMIGVEPVKPDS